MGIKNGTPEARVLRNQKLYETLSFLEFMKKWKMERQSSGGFLDKLITSTYRIGSYRVYGKCPWYAQILFWFPEYLGKFVSQTFLNCYIWKEATIDWGFKIYHGSGITINEWAIVGKNCLFMNQTTIGATGDFQIPTLGDAVFLGVGARVLGDINVGNRVEIGANAVVTKDIPDDVHVVGANRIIGVKEPALSYKQIRQHYHGKLRKRN